MARMERIKDWFGNLGTTGKVITGVVVALVALTIFGLFLPSETEPDTQAKDDATPSASPSEDAPLATETPTPEATETVKVTPTVKPEPEAPKVTANEIEATFLANSGGRAIEDSCDAAFTAWQCFYDGVELPNDGRLQVNLSPAGDISKDDVRDMAERARLHWFNFIGADYPELDAITTMVNGRDMGTTYRRDVPLLN